MPRMFGVHYSEEDKEAEERNALQLAWNNSPEGKKALASMENATVPAPRPDPEDGHNDNR